MRQRSLSVALAIAASTLLLVAPFILFTDGYRLDIARFAFYIAALTITWSLLAGSAGQFSLAHVAIAGVAAYAGVLSANQLHGNIWLAVATGTLSATGIGAALGALLGRLRGPYLALFTLAFAEICRRVIVAESDVTGGENSLPIHQLPGTSLEHYYYVLAILFVTVIAVLAIQASRIGLFFRAMREDEDAAQALGINVVRIRVFAFAFSSFLVGLVATFYFYTNTRISPEDLDLFVMSQVMAYAVIGGVENALAAGTAAVVFSLALENLRTINIGAAHIDTGIWRFAIFGLMMMLTVRFARNGLLFSLFEWLSGRRSASRGAVEARFGDATERGHDERPLPETTIAGPSKVDLRVEDIHFGFAGNRVLQGISFEVVKPQICGLIGPNGAGKSTLVNVLTGVYRPDSGAVWLGNERIEGLGPSDVAQRGLGRTFQITRPLRRMTVIENMAVGLEARAPFLQRLATVERCSSILEWLGLAHLQHEFARALSGGQQKLLEIARLAVRDPSILILDEPFAGVHPNLRDVIGAFIQRLRDRGKAVIIIEHDIEALLRICDRLIVLADGHLIADEIPEVVRTDPAVIEAYLGTQEAVST